MGAPTHQLNFFKLPKNQFFFALSCFLMNELISKNVAGVFLFELDDETPNITFYRTAKEIFFFFVIPFHLLGWVVVHFWSV